MTFNVYAILLTTFLAAIPAISQAQTNLPIGMSDNEKVWLQVGSKKVLGLYRNETTGKTRGGALIIPNPNHKPYTAGLVNSIRNALPLGNWHTLALDLTSTDNIGDPEIQQTISAGIAHLNEKGIYNIVLIGTEMGGVYASHYLANIANTEPTNLTKSLRALVLIDSNNVIPNNDNHVTKSITAIQLPILDAYSVGNLRKKQQADNRKRARYREGSKQNNYQQVKLPQLVNYEGTYENRITQRIRGWLDNNAAGFMVDQK